jgi:transcriptional regulator with XRE-family HTH domain
MKKAKGGNRDGGGKRLLPSLKNKRGTGAVDTAIGARVRIIRLERNLSQSDLADGLGLSFQQIQKYEKGANRISSGRLHQIANILKVNVLDLIGSNSDEPFELVNSQIFKIDRKIMLIPEQHRGPLLAYISALVSIYEAEATKKL